MANILFAQLAHKVTANLLKMINYCGFWRPTQLRSPNITSEVHLGWSMRTYILRLYCMRIGYTPQYNACLRFTARTTYGPRRTDNTTSDFRRISNNRRGPSTNCSKNIVIIVIIPPITGFTYSAFGVLYFRKPL